jgi:hypothetical protein
MATEVTIRQGHPTPNQKPPMKKSLKPFGVGIAGWILGLLILFGLSWPLSSPDTIANAVMWTLKNWWAAYAFGLVALVVSALRGKIAPAAPLLAYLLPIAVIVGLAMVFMWIYPNSGFREDLLSYIPVAVVFYILSWIWISLGKEKEPDLIKASTPPLFGGIMILGLVAVPVFTSNAFIYRNAFALDVLEVQRPDKALVAKCVLEIHKPGDYEFRSPSFHYFDMFYPEMGDEQTAPTVTVVWGDAGKPANGASGKYPLEIRWDNIPNGDLFLGAESMPEAVPVLLEVHTPQNPQELLYTLTGWMPESSERQNSAD